MQRNLRGYVLGSFLIGAMGFAACSSDDEGDDDGVGGSDMGGAGGMKTGTTGKVGGAGPTGGTKSSGTGGVGATSSSTPGSTTAPQGGTGPTSSAPTGGTSPATTTVVAGATSTGGATTATGGAPSGGATATGGTTAAGGTTGLAGAAGNAGDPGVAGAAGASSTTPPPPRWAFDAADGWTVTDSGWGTIATTTFAVAGGVGTLTIPFTAANQSGMIAVNGVNADLTGKTVTVRIRHVSGGKTAGQNLAFTVVLIAQDGDWSSKFISVDGNSFSAMPVNTEFSEFAYPVPAASGDFDPVLVNALRVQVRADTWGDPPAVPTTEPAIFAIDSVTY